MIPKEIAQLKQQSPTLHIALNMPGNGVYTFLRHKVVVDIHYTTEYLVPVTDSVISGMVSVMPHQVPCGHCRRLVAHDRLLASPYNSSYRPGDLAWEVPHGWCIDCVLGGFFTPDMPLYDTYADPDSPKYDPVYANNKRVWEHWYDLPDDYDGPPIWIA